MSQTRKDDDKPTRVLNLAMMGTGHHRSKMDNILTSWIDSMDTGVGNQYKLLLDGPGATPRNDPDNPMLGTYDATVTVDSENQLKVKKTPRDFIQQKSVASGLVLGQGYDDAIDEALKAVKALIGDPDPDHGEKITLNMAGFSRGSDTILRISNAIYAEYGTQVAINIFAIDPVPGPFRQGSRKARIIPPNVKNYHAVLMRDEARPIMRSQDKQHLVVEDPNETQVIYTELHGIHGTGTRINGDFNKPDGNHHGVRDTAILTWEALRQFSQDHGIQFKNNMNIGNDNKELGIFPYKQNVREEGKKITKTIHREDLDDKKKLDSYSRMLLNKKIYHKIGDGVGTHRRKFTQNNLDYFHYGQKYFVDKQHMALFKNEYPAVFNWLFQAGASDIYQEAKNTKYNTNIKTTFSNDDRKTEMLKLQNDQALADSLKEYLKENFPGLNNGWELPVHPQGIPPLSPELEIQWEGIQRIAHATLRGHDKSMSKSEAKQFYRNAQEILFKPTNTDPNDTASINDAKKNEINKLINEMIKQHQKEPLLVYKLNVIKQVSDKNNKVDIEAVKNHVTASMKAYLDRIEFGGIGRNTEVLAKKKAVADTVIDLLKNATNAHEVQSILSVALQETTKARKGKFIEGELDNRLRNCILDISTNIPSSLSSEDRVENREKAKANFDKNFKGYAEARKKELQQQANIFILSIAAIAPGIALSMALYFTTRTIQKQANRSSTADILNKFKPGTTAPSKRDAVSEKDQNTIKPIPTSEQTPENTQVSEKTAKTQPTQPRRFTM